MGWSDRYEIFESQLKWRAKVALVIARQTLSGRDVPITSLPTELNYEDILPKADEAMLAQGEMTEEQTIDQLKQALNEKSELNIRKGLITFSRDSKKFMLVLDKPDSFIGVGSHKALLSRSKYYTANGEVGAIQLDWFRLDVESNSSRVQGVTLVPPSIDNPQLTNQNLLQFQGIEAKDLPTHSSNASWKDYQRDGMIQIARLLLKALGERAQGFMFHYPADYFPELKESGEFDLLKYVKANKVKEMAELRLSTEEKSIMSSSESEEFRLADFQHHELGNMMNSVDSSQSQLIEEIGDKKKEVQSDDVHKEVSEVYERWLRINESHHSFTNSDKKEKVEAFWNYWAEVGKSMNNIEDSLKNIASKYAFLAEVNEFKHLLDRLNVAIGYSLILSAGHEPSIKTAPDSPQLDTAAEVLAIGSGLRTLATDRPWDIVSGFTIQQITAASGLEQKEVMPVLQEMEKDWDVTPYLGTTESKERFVFGGDLTRDFYGRSLGDEELYHLGEGLVSLFRDHLNYTLGRAIQFSHTPDLQAITQDEAKEIQPILDRLNVINNRHKGIQRDIFGKISDWQKIPRRELIATLNEVLGKIKETIVDIQWLQDQDISKLEDTLKVAGDKRVGTLHMLESYQRGLITGLAHLEMVRDVYSTVIPNDAIKNTIQGLFGKKGSFVDIAEEEELYVYEGKEGKTHVLTLKHQDAHLGRRPKFASYRHDIYDETGQLEEIRIRNYDLDHILFYRRDFIKPSERIYLDNAGRVDATLSGAKETPIEAKEALEEANFFIKGMSLGVHVDFMNLNETSSDFQLTQISGDLENLNEFIKAGSAVLVPTSVPKLQGLLTQKVANPETGSLKDHESSEVTEITVEHGIHGRVAALITIAAGTRSNLEITLEYNGKRARAKSIMEVLALGGAKGKIAIQVKGGDVEARAEAINAIKLIITPPLKKEDEAMLNSKQKEGGINLDPAQMTLETKKEGQDFHFNLNGQEIDAAQVVGAEFEIQQMLPVTNLPMLLGLSKSNSQQPVAFQISKK